MPNPKPKLVPDSAGGYEVHLYGAIIGRVSKGDRKWYATLGEQDLGEHDTRREAIEAMMVVYFT
jgi:hypothetical protein